MKLKKYEIALVIALLIMLLSGFKVDHDMQALSEKLIRIHVVANSDTDEDQTLKLEVRDKILEFIAPMIEKAENRKEAEEIINDKMPEILKIAEKTINEKGYLYDMSGTLMTEYFPTVEYDTFSLPEGEYMSLRVIIGEGKGHNWWCVVFPALCTSALIEETEETLLSDTETALITRGNSTYVIKFKIAEIIGSIKHSLFG